MVYMTWFTHMKTTIDIADPLFRQAKRLAARRNTTFKELVENALREELSKELSNASATAIKTHTFRGQGMQAGLSWDDWSSIRSLSYEGRGG